MGRADPLETASLLVVAGHVLPPEALFAITSAGRRLLGLPPVAVAVGSPADLVAIRAPSLGGAIAGGSPERIVFRGGRVVAGPRSKRSTPSRASTPLTTVAASHWGPSNT